MGLLEVRQEPGVSQESVARNFGNLQLRNLEKMSQKNTGKWDPSATSWYPETG